MRMDVRANTHCNPPIEHQMLCLASISYSRPSRRVYVDHDDDNDDDEERRRGGGQEGGEEAVV